MKKIFIILSVIIGLISCGKKEIKVPKVKMEGAEEVANNSIIWMFRNEDGSIDVNEKNRISSTNWFFNIDKQLTLKQLIPEVKRLVIKHNEKSPHNTKPMKNYFTYVNSLNNHLSFYQFDSINFNIINKNRLPKFSGDTITVNVNSSTMQIPTVAKNTIIQPIFNSEMNFQEYMETKALFNNVLKGANISKVELIVIDN